MGPPMLRFSWFGVAQVVVDVFADAPRGAHGISAMRYARNELEVIIARQSRWR